MRYKNLIAFFCFVPFSCALFSVALLSSLCFMVLFIPFGWPYHVLFIRFVLLVRSFVRYECLKYTKQPDKVNGSDS